MRISFQLIFLCSVFLSTNFALGQQRKRISKKDQNEIQRVCGVYLRQYDIILTDYTTPTDSLLEVISPPVSDLLLARREYFQKMAYENLQFPEYKIIGLELEDSIGCLVLDADEEIEFKVNLKEINDSWIVVGYENHEIDQADIDKQNKFISSELNALSIKDSIKGILKEFVNAWSELRQTKNSDGLKSITTTEFYDYLVATREYEDLKGYGNEGVTLKDMERVEIHQDTAWCRVGIMGRGGSYFSLLLQDNVWLVSGADHRICTRQDVIDVEEDIAHFHEFQKFNERILLFDKQLEAFLKTGDGKLMRETASDYLIGQLEIYRRLAGTIDTNFLRLHGIGGMSRSYWNLKIDEDTALYEAFSDSTRWIKKGEKWLLDDLFVNITEKNDVEKAYRTLREFTDMIHLSYSVYNTLSEGGAPPVVWAGEITDYSKVEYHHRLDDYHKEVVYETGNDQLFIDLQNEITQVSNKTSFKGVIYVEFYVDHLGKAQNIHALDQIGTNEAQLAEDIVRELGNWLPNDHKQSSLTNMVVPIQF